MKNVDELAEAILNPVPKFVVDKEEIAKDVIDKKDAVLNEQKIKDVKREPPIPEEPVVLKKEIEISKLDIPPKDILSIVNLSIGKGLPKIPISPKAGETVPVVNNPPKDEIKNKLDLADEPNKKKEIKEEVFNDKEKNVENKTDSKNNEIKKEILIEKIKEHQEAQEKLIAEGEKLMNELKIVVKEEMATNTSKELGVNVKLNSVQGIVKKSKKDDKQQAELEKPKYVMSEDPIVARMAKGVPLPLAVQGNLEMNAVGKEKPKSENEIVEKVGRDILGGDTKEMREKRDIEEVLRDNSQVILDDQITSQPLAKVPINQEMKKATTVGLEVKPIKVEEGSCAKNNSVKDVKKEEIQKMLASDPASNRTNKEQSEEKAADQLIKFSSHLSDPKPILDISPQLLDNKVDTIMAEMPKKRDLKSIETNELGESNHRNT